MRCGCCTANGEADGRVTLDSFYEGGRYFAQLALPRTEERNLIHGRDCGRTSKLIGGSPMRRLTFYLSMFGVVLALAWSTQDVSYAQDFYAGKTIRIVVGFPAGG